MPVNDITQTIVLKKLKAIFNNSKPCFIQRLMYNETKLRAFLLLEGEK